MTRNNAVLTALTIVQTCEESQNDYNGSCGNCPFRSSVGCIVTNGDNIPTDWQINELMDKLITK